MGLFDSAATALGGARDALVGGATKAFGMAQSIAQGTARSGDSSYVPPAQRPEYLVYITRDPDGAQREGIQVVATLPEEFGFNLTSTWAAPFAEGLVNSEKINMMTQLLGMKWSNQAMSSNFWTGSGEVEFSLPLILTAESSYTDILRPIRDLVVLSTPTTDSMGFFRAPGPAIRASAELKDLIQSTLNIGKAAAQGNMQPLTDSAASGLSAAKDTVAAVATDPESVYKGVRDGLVGLMQFDGKISLQIGQFMLLPSIVITSVSQNYKVLMSRDGVPMQVQVTVDIKTHQTPSADDVKDWYRLGATMDSAYGGY